MKVSLGEKGFAEASFLIRNRLGLHLKTISILVKEARRFRSDLRLVKDGMEADAKSIMGIALLAASCGTKVTVLARGEDAEEAVEAIGQLIDSGFGEE